MSRRPSQQPSRSRREDDDRSKVKTVRSDTPTVAIAPSDYQHIYAAAKDTAAAKPKVDTRGNPVQSNTGGGGPPVRHVKSDTPTVAIAPSDYQHIYAAAKDTAAAKPKVDTRGSPVQSNTGGGGPPVRHVKSDTPTVAIAPSDYQHIYAAAKDTAAAKPKVDTRGNAISTTSRQAFPSRQGQSQSPPVKTVKSDTPTVAIAPSDYQHIYAAAKDTAAAKPKVDTRGTPVSATSPRQSQAVRTVKSDSPTVAIAPSDYQHIYAAAKDKTAAAPKVDTRGNAISAKPSATPTAAIAPSDYQHIYQNKPGQTETPTTPPPQPDVIGQNFYAEDFTAGNETENKPKIEPEVYHTPKGQRKNKTNQEGISAEVVAMVIAFINRQPKKYSLKRERQQNRS